MASMTRPPPGPGPFEQVKGRSSGSRTGSKAGAPGGSAPQAGATSQPVRASRSAGACSRPGAPRAEVVDGGQGAGSTARSVGRARDLEPGHRRDGMRAGAARDRRRRRREFVVRRRAAGRRLDRHRGAHASSVWAVVLVPIVLGVIAVMLMRTEPDLDARPRLILGSAMIGLPVLGLWHAIWLGAPLDPVASAMPPASSASFWAGRSRTG